ncbi:MAG: IPT/TIG domain-containing protein, partial [Opitutales bacterium]
MKAALTFTQVFSGAKTIVGFAYPKSGSLGGPSAQLGTWTVAAASPVISAGGVVNAASFAPGPIAPGEIVTIFGTGLGPAMPATATFDASGTLATIAGNTRVLFNGVAAPMVSASATQVSAIVPYAVAVPTVQVEYEGHRSAPAALAPASAAPGIFTYPGKSQAVAVN